MSAVYSCAQESDAACWCWIDQVPETWYMIRWCRRWYLVRLQLQFIDCVRLAARTLPYDFFVTAFVHDDGTDYKQQYIGYDATVCLLWHWYPCLPRPQMKSLQCAQNVGWRRNSDMNLCPVTWNIGNQPIDLLVLHVFFVALHRVVVDRWTHPYVLWTLVRLFPHFVVFLKTMFVIYYCHNVALKNSWLSH